MAVVLLAAACGEADPESGADPTDSPPGDTPSDDTVGDEPVDLAVADFATHLDIDPAGIEVATDELVTWRDGSLGCPEPGMEYTQALVEGYRIVLHAGGEEASYHGATGEPPFRCDDPDPVGTVGGPSEELGPTGEPQAEQSADPGATKNPSSPPAEAAKEDVMDDDPVGQAIADLASQAGVSRDDIKVVANEQVTWRDGSLGCPEPGMMYTQALVDGYRIVLRAMGEDVSYHGQLGKAPFRCDDPDSNGAVGTRPNQ